MTDFEKFQHEEYEHIAEAHFRTIEAISSFFRYYLIIMSLPLTTLGAFLAFAGKDEKTLDYIEKISPYAAVAFGVVAFIGFFTMLYIINLRFDVILYARTVNAIRKYFYDRGDIDSINILRLRVLPQSPYKPSYFERAYFSPVILTFGFFNSLYAEIPYITFRGFSGNIFDALFLKDNAVELIVFFVALCLLHLIVYYLYARHREYSYLQANGIGVDIDGVLNSHREQFCKFLSEKTGINIQPEQIKTLPVHEDAVLNVSRENEFSVFNDPTYWSSMPAPDDVAPSLQKLRNALQVKVHLFTHRPWPDLTGSSHPENTLITDEWHREAARVIDRSDQSYGVVRLLKKYALGAGLIQPISVITKCWLRDKDIPYNSLTIERGNENLANPNTKYRNRFNIARKKNIRYFVEDDWEKAVKLAYICDVVFLIDHPYNQQKDDETRTHLNQMVLGQLPNNVIRVSSWSEIYKLVRQMT